MSLRCCAAVLLLLLLASGRAAGIDPFAQGALAAGDYDALARQWLAEVEHAPDAPAAEVLLRGVERMRGAMIDPQPLRAPLERIAGQAAGFTRAVAVRLLLDLLEDAGDWDAIARVRAESGLIADWCVVGTWGITNRTSLDEPFLPEIRPDDPALAGPGPEPVWRAVPPVGIRIGFDPFDFLWPRRGAAYALAQFRLDAPAEAVLTISCGGSFRAWVNGRPALAVLRGRAFHPQENAARVSLGAGWNRILLKTSAGNASAFQVWLTDPEGRPLRPAEVEPKAVVHQIPAGESPPPRAFDWPAWAHYAAIAADPTRPEPREVLLGALLAHWGEDEDEALHRMRQALARAPADPVVQAYAAEVHQAAFHYPDTWRRSRAREHLRRAAELDPAFAPAQFGLATLLESDHKVREAIDALLKVLEAHPRCAHAHTLLLRLYREREWQPQAEQEVARLEEIAPGSVGVAVYWFDRRRSEKNYAEALAWAEKLAARRSGILFQQVSALESAGQIARAIELWRDFSEREPRDFTVLRRLAAMEEAVGRTEAAEACFQRILQWVPDHAEAWNELGDLRLRTSRTPEALEAWRTSLRIDPSDAALRRELAWLDRKQSGSDAIGDPDEFWKPWEVDALRLVDGSPRRTDLPTSSVVYLLDQAVVRVNPDGSYSEYIHQVVKILNERGIDKYDKVDIQGEILEARTLTPDGSVLEPVVIPGERALTMPRVNAEAVIDYAFRRNSRERPLGRFEYPNFYFQDPNFDGTFILSEMVVLVPKGFRFRAAEINLPGPAKVTQRGEHVAYHWRVQNAPHIEPEGHMPHFRNLLPYVQVAEQQTWADVWTVLRESFWSRCLSTHDVREWAAAACAGRTTRAEKAEALYYSAVEQVRDGGGLDSAISVLTERSGNRLVLLKAALDAVGVPSAFVATRPNGANEPPPPWDMPRPDLFDSVTANGLLLRIELDDGSFAWASGAGRYLPFGEMPPDRRGGWGLVLADGGPEIAVLPVGDPAAYATAVERALGTHQEYRYEPSLEGPTQVTARVWTVGPEATFWKERFADVDAPRRRIFLETIYNPVFPGLVVDSLEFQDLESARLPFRAEFSLRIRSFLSPQGERFSCPLGLVPLKLQRALVSEAKRKLPIHLEEPYGSRSRSAVKLPEGTRCARLPEGLTLQSGFGTYSLAFARGADPAGGETIEATRSYLIPPQDVPPEDYPRFIEFCRAIDQAEGQRIVVERAR